jgi:hypothetical protein
MIRNHLHDVFGWGDSNTEVAAEDEIRDLERTYPAPADLNQMLSFKNYLKWARNLRDRAWSVDIRELIIAHSHVLNLPMPKFEDGVLEGFEQMKSLRSSQREVMAKIKVLEKERDSISNQLDAVHKKIFKTKID